MEPQNHLFADIKLSDVSKPERDIVVLSGDTAVSEATAQLSAAKIQSAPVQKPGASEDSEFDVRFQGYVDVLHLARFVLEQASQTDKPLDSLEALFSEMEVFAETKLSAMDLPDMIPVSTESSLLEAMIVTSRYNLRRIPLITPTTGSLPGKLHNFLTPSRLMAAVADVCQAAAVPLDKVSVESLNLPSFGNVVTANESDSFLSALASISAKNISAVAVVNAEGQLVNNLSASDVRLVVEFPLLFAAVTRGGATVREFFDCLSESGEQVRQPITVQPAEPLSAAMDKMVANKIHRVYVVDAQGKPVGVVSVADVVGVLVEEPDSFDGN